MTDYQQPSVLVSKCSFVLATGRAIVQASWAAKERESEDVSSSIHFATELGCSRWFMGKSVLVYFRKDEITVQVGASHSSKASTRTQARLKIAGPASVQSNMQLSPQEHAYGNCPLNLSGTETQKAMDPPRGS